MLRSRNKYFKLSRRAPHRRRPSTGLLTLYIDFFHRPSFAGMSSSVSFDHDFAVNRAMHHSQYPFARFAGLDKADPNTRQRPRPAPTQAQRRTRDDSAIPSRPLVPEVDRLHRRHESLHHGGSSQILDLVSPSPRLPKQPSDTIRHYKDNSITQSPRIPSYAKPHTGSSDEILGRHMSQLSLSGFELSADKQKLHKRHQSLASRQHSLHSSNPLVSPTSLVAMLQDSQSVVSPDTRILVHEGHDNFTTEKNTPLLGTQSSSHSPPVHRSLAFWLILYFCFNLGLTLYNKGVLIHFPFPYTLTALHAFCGTFGGLILLKIGAFVPAKLSDVDNLALVAFSILYTINIAVSNISLQLVTIPVSGHIPCIGRS